MSNINSNSSPPEGEAEDRRRLQDDVIVESLAAGMSYPEVAEVASCSPRTVARRMADPEFAARVR